MADACGAPVRDALARTARLTVDCSEIDAQRLCPECFAGWIARYDREMRSKTEAGAGADGARGDGDGEIIVD